MDHTQAYKGISGLGRQEIKLGLERMRELMSLLGDPQDSLKFIHVAGTNGKGSTCSFISAALAANGCRVTLLFNDQTKPGLRKEIALMLLDSFREREGKNYEASVVPVQSFD